MPFSRYLFKNSQQIIIKASLAEFIFRKIPCFQHIFFLWASWDGCVWIIKLFFEAQCILFYNFQLKKKKAFRLPLTAWTKLLILDIKTTFRLEKPHCKDVWWKLINNEAVRVIKLKWNNKQCFSLCLDWMWSLGLSGHFFCRARSTPRKLGAYRKKFVHHWVSLKKDVWINI